MKKLILGIDPGYTGAIALYDLETKKLRDVIDMPVISSKLTTNRKGQITKGARKKTDLNTYEIAIYLLKHREEILGAIIEDVHSMPDQGVVSMFNFGYSTGLVTGIVAANLIPYQKVKPASWKSLMGLTTNKALSRLRAQKFFPEFSIAFSKARDDGRAEAALLAKFGERIFKMEKENKEFEDANFKVIEG